MKKLEGSILFVINSLSVGGASKMLKYVANNSTEWFESVSVISLYDKAIVGDLDEKIKQYPMSFSHSSVKDKLSLIFGLRKQIKKLAPNIVCSFVSDVCFYTKVATTGMKCKIVSAERGDPYTLPEKWKKRVEWAYKKSDACFFQTKMARDFFDESVINKSFVIPNPYIPTSQLSNISFKSFEKRQKTIVGAGRFVPQKGFDVLISAFAKIHTKYPEYRLRLVGEGVEREKYIEQASELSVLEYIDFPGYVKNLQDEILEDGIFVLSSRFEGIPNSLIEAMTAGLPTISTNCTPGGPQFLTDDGRRGILVPVDDVDAIAASIEKLIESPELCDEYSRLGFELVDILAEDKITSLWRDAFEKIYMG